MTKRKSSSSSQNAPKYCKACNGSDHTRRSSKLCPKYIKRQKLIQHEEGLRECPATNLIGLQSILLDPAIHPVIIDAVSRMTDITCEATRLMNGFVMHRLEHNLDMPNLSFSGGGKLRQFFAGVLSRMGHPFMRNLVTDNDINDYIDNFYQVLRPNNLAWNNGFRLAQLIDNACRIHSTNCQNHIVMNLPKKLRIWMEYKLRKHAGHLVDGRNLLKLVGYLMDSLEGDVALPAEPFIGLDEDEQIDLHASIHHIKDRVAIILGGLDMNNAAMEANWWNYLKPMSRILKTFTNNYEEDAAERELTGRRGKWLRLFSLVPISRFRQKHIHICTTALYYILKDAGWNLPTKEAFREDGMEWWLQAFALHKITSVDRRFAFSIATDGVKVSVHVLKTADDIQVNDWGYDMDGIYQPYAIAEGTRVIGLDPGRNDLYAASSGLDAGNELKCSNGRWREISGSTYSAKKVKTWTQGQPEFQEYLTTMPTAKCYRHQDYNAHLIHFLESRDELLGFYRDLKWRRLLWKTRIKRQKAYHTLAMELTGGDPNTVIAYGGGKFNHASRGMPATPNQHLFVELKKYCRTILVPEFRTSQICCTCNVRVRAFAGLWAVKKCEVSELSDHRLALQSGTEM